MPLKADLSADVQALIDGEWDTRDGRVVPDTTSVTLGNDGVRIDAVVLYADLADSTIMVDTYPDWFAAEMYKSFLVCAAKIIRSEGGTITSYDGDRVMAVYIGDMRCDRAIRSAQKINWAVLNIIRPRVAAKHPQLGFVLKHVCGIDQSTLLATKTGARNDNDLVWVGPAANYAAKLSAMDDAWSTYTSFDVWQAASDRVRLVGGRGDALFRAVYWPGRGETLMMRSNSYWSLD
jgi:class 3 adenylate cyclase